MNIPPVKLPPQLQPQPPNINVNQLHSEEDDDAAGEMVVTIAHDDVTNKRASLIMVNDQMDAVE